MFGQQPTAVRGLRQNVHVARALECRKQQGVFRPPHRRVVSKQRFGSLIDCVYQSLSCNLTIAYQCHVAQYCRGFSSRLLLAMLLFERLSHTHGNDGYWRMLESMQCRARFQWLEMQVEVAAYIIAQFSCHYAVVRRRAQSRTCRTHKTNQKITSHTTIKVRQKRIMSLREECPSSAP